MNQNLKIQLFLYLHYNALNHMSLLCDYISSMKHKKNTIFKTNELKLYLLFNLNNCSFNKSKRKS